MRVTVADGQRPVKIAHNEKTLLAYLLLWPGRSHTRSILAALCWGDQAEEQAKACLSTTLWRLRRSLEANDGHADQYLITSQDGRIGFNWECDHWLDSKTFDECARNFLAVSLESLQQQHADAIEAVLPIYAGDLLEGFYDSWVLRERERLNLVYADSLLRLMQYYKQCGAYERSLEFGQRILRGDSLREDVHREIMYLYAQTGRRTQAIQQYETCRKLLAAELEVTPMPETELLYAAILANSDLPASAVAAALMGRSAAPLQMADVLRQLQAALCNMAAAQECVTKVIELITKIEQ
jgi:DNA-binding SARP family transcriptional activator